RLRRHRAGQLRAVPDPLARLDRAGPRQDARAAGDRLVQRRAPGGAATALLAETADKTPEFDGQSGARVVLSVGHPGREFNDASSAFHAPRSTVPAGPRDERPPAAPGGPARRGAVGAGAEGPRPGADRRAPGRRARPAVTAGVGVRRRAGLGYGHRTAA